eukprot:694193-Prymnesium_polylepis.1
MSRRLSSHSCARRSRPQTHQARPRGRAARPPSYPPPLSRRPQAPPPAASCWVTAGCWRLLVACACCLQCRRLWHAQRRATNQEGAVAGRAQGSGSCCGVGRDCSQ